MIEKDIEANIMAAVKALALPGLDVRGAWQSVAAGEVKDVEPSDAPASLYVRVGPRSFENYSLPEATFPVTLTFAIRIDLNPTGDALETFCDPVAGVLQAWNLDIAAGRDICELDVAGFTPHFIQFTGGEGPINDDEAKMWSVVFNLTVGGTVSSQQGTQEES